MKQIIIILFIPLATFSSAQQKGYSGGFQFKGMIANNFINGTGISKTLDSVTVNNNQRFGYIFGMTIRKQFNKRVGMETGLRFVQRNFTTTIDSMYSQYSGALNYRIIGYEIPLKGLITLPASKNSYFVGSIGGQLDLFPSDVYSTDTDYQWQVVARRKSWLYGSFIFNIGWEIHTEDMGALYVGMSFNRPFGNPFELMVGYYNSSKALETYPLDAVYLSFDIRYYFESKTNK